jgi:hypothetical protein
MRSLTLEKETLNYPYKNNFPDSLLYIFSKKLKSKSRETSCKKTKGKNDFVDHVNGYIETITSQKCSKNYKHSQKSMISSKTKKIEQHEARPQNVNSIDHIRSNIK